VRVYATLDDPRLPLRDVPAWARRAEDAGFHGVLVPEAVHDGFLTALLALEHTSTLRVATSVVVAFARSPTVVAYAAWDLQQMSGGRFALGLGTQVKANVEGRFGVAWTPPVARMRDYVGALRAVWASWQERTPLVYESPSYRLSRMQPFFDPGPIAHPRIPVYLGGVGPRMLALAGEVADGLMTHPTNSDPRYLREHCLPAIAKGAARAGRPASDVELIASAFVATGPDRAAVARERARFREYLGFLYSTPQYWPTLDLHGWRAVGERLRALVRAGRWQEMPATLGDEILDTLVPAGTYEEIAPVLHERYGGVPAAITLRLPEDSAADTAVRRLIAALTGA
jgi:probable F420-dependent oxidoreductase